MIERFKNEAVNRRIQRAYKENTNYLVRSIGSAENTAYIYFSSNGLYFPDTLEEIERTFACDYYEWGRIASHREVQKKASQNIFVRDVYKSWYVFGVNEEINTQEKLATVLKELTQGKRVITIGVSAGAYAAVLFGTMLNAERIIAFSPQIDLRLANQQEKIRLFEQFESNEAYAENLNLVERIRHYSGQLVYLYPEQNARDCSQAALIHDMSNVMLFRQATSTHGASLHPESTVYLLTCTDCELRELHRYFFGRKFTIFSCLCKTHGIAAVVHMARYVIKKIAAKILKRFKR